MFDKDTLDVIAGAPSLDGLDLQVLPKRLTNAYASIVSARLRIRALGANQESLPQDILSILEEMRRVGNTYEALVAISPGRDDRGAAAFVAGAAHHVRLMANQVTRIEGRTTYLATDSIAPEVSAALLFLIAEATSDAAETAKLITSSDGPGVEASLLASIRLLATGRLWQIAGLRPPDPDELTEGDLISQGTKGLYYRLFVGVQALARALLGQADRDVPRTIFDEVKGLSVERLDVVGLEGVSAFSSYPGPYYLACLLSSVARDLPDASVVRLPPPSGVDGGAWTATLNGIATRRPYLWRNHRQAVAAGYLESGTSAVVGFPTGAGKSTLSELKIGATLLRGDKVVFLAPTLALVDQTARALSETFKDRLIEQQKSDDLLAAPEGEELQPISVMTPERCLALQSFNAHAFSDVGLLVFDECHLLHPGGSGRSRRAIDSMLCVLNMVELAPHVEFLLLSAMMENADEIAEWLGEVTGRRSIALNLSWKPTRQVRGCVVYGSTEIQRLNQRLADVRATSTTSGPPSSLKKELSTQALGLFCLHQTWQSQRRDDYALLPLLASPVSLGVAKNAYNNNWHLTPNWNQVAAALGESTARQGIKTLIFVQTVKWADSTVARLNVALPASQCSLTAEERELYEWAVDELGGVDRTYLSLDADGKLACASACHHGELLAPERNLHESLYRRRDGINVLVATSTLAQGMNLPSEVVVIAGDSRFDPHANRMERLEAHELLNAAGRAGRAGEAAYGFVVVIPSKVVDFDNQTSHIHTHWEELRAIFAQSDRCLKIDDPLQSLLDEVHAGAALTEDAQYLLRRLPVGSGGAEGDVDEPTRNLVRRSFAAYRARKDGRAEWVETRADNAIAKRRAGGDLNASPLDWVERAAASAGVPQEVIRDLGAWIAVSTLADNAPMMAWYERMFEWLERKKEWIPVVFREQSLESIFGTPYRSLETSQEKGEYALGRIRNLLSAWMSGATHVDIERMFETPEARIGRCSKARDFVNRVVPECAYLFGLPSVIYRVLELESEERAEPPLGLGVLGSCVRDGLKSTEMLALAHLSASRRRRLTHRRFGMIQAYLADGEAGENFAGVVARVDSAVTIARLMGEFS